MHCCEFEMVVTYMKMKITEMRIDCHLSRYELADILMDNGVTKIDQLPDVVSIARNLERQSRMRLVA